MAIKKMNNDKLNNIAGGHNAEKEGYAWVFYCKNCGDTWSEWDETKSFKGGICKCPRCQCEQSLYCYPTNYQTYELLQSMKMKRVN